MSIREQAFRCPDPETIAALTEGRIAEADLDSILEHVESCPSCLEGLELATRAMAAEAMATHRAPRFPMWLAVAAAFVLAILGGAVWQWSARQRGPAMADLVKLAPADARLVEPRLSAAFAYGPYRGPMRASGSVTDAQRLRLGGVAANALEQADRDPSPESQHVAGVAMLLADDPLKAAERLRLASERAPNDARMASDLAAAQYAAAETLGRASLLPEALAAADQALRADPNLAAASFNRALILDRLGLEREARRAWERYLAIDPASPWAGEARRRLARLPRAAAKPLPSLDRAVQANDRSAVRAIVGQATQQARTTAEAEHLGQWGEAIVRGDRAEAARRLMLARATGEALRSISTESLLHDAVIAIDGAGPARELALARAHAVYRQGRMAYSRELLEDAARDLHAAASGFAAAASPMELVARYYAANVLFERGEIARAREELEELLRISDGHPAYLALRAQIRWQLALCAMDDDDWTMASARLAEAEALFAGLEERGNLAFVRSMLATTLMSSGKPDDAWSARMHAFAALSEEDQGHRLAVALSAAARMEQRAGRPDAARALLGVEVEEARQSGNAFLIADALLRNAIVSEERGDHRKASAHVREARAEASRIAEGSLRERAVADCAVAEGVVLLDDDPRRAAESLSAAIGFYRGSGLAAFLPNAYLQRARAAMHAGDTDGARRDLESGIAELERQPLRFAGVVTASPVLGAGDALFDDAIRLSVTRGDAMSAFDYAERSRTVKPVAIEALQQRLRGTTTAVLQLTTLPDEVIAFAVASDDRLLARAPLPRAHIAELEGAIDRGETAPLREMFDLLIRPCARIVDRATDLIIVADRRLQRVPFAALYDAQRRLFLVERMSVALTPSASELEAEGAAGSRSVLLVALPAGEANVTQALPESVAEIDDVARLYTQSRRTTDGEATYSAVPASRNVVVHIAGHTESRRRDDDAALRFADGERATWSRIAAGHLDRSAVVVLAACNTLRASSLPHVRSLSLGAAFLAAGAGSVIGTLTPIGDADAHELFLAIHKSLAAGASPARAVRRAQLDALASGRLPAWQSIALMTRCISRTR